MTPQEESLLVHFEAWELPQDAIAWLLDVWRLTQFLDDVTDRTEMAPESVQKAVWNIFVTFPGNPFFLANAAQLQPALATAVLKWEAANQAERRGLADQRSFMWRACYYDVVLLVVLLCQGRDSAMEKAPAVMALYGENYDEYRAEFPHV